MGGVGDITLYEGIVRKQSGDLAWKRRYLCIRGALEEGERLDAGRIPRFKSLDLVLAVSKETMRQQCIATPFAELEDVFPVPSKYTGSNARHVFAVAFKTGKRLLFQARGDPERDEWMQKIQEALGIDDDE
ncbi:serine/threonine protein kinase [Trypanosoma conorhini]|uniref:Serine/threonine protein kinase n=1 Tax=Trypanosoma conorhini TaxID=83891 RepID=A0A422MTH3_9TRYP|nr:serine/threonine protein kinase [Trypanosoma conorhini]RNE96509.1 serine/threonine protein kinase [Trypanosoma conorhini]